MIYIQLVALELLLLRIKIHKFQEITPDFQACKLNSCIQDYL